MTEQKIWRLVFATAIGDNSVDSFECDISSISKYIGKAGALRAVIDIPSRPEKDILALTSVFSNSDYFTSMGQRLEQIIYGVGKLSVYAYYGDDLWWGGYLTQVSVIGNRGGTALDISAISWEGFLDRIVPQDEDYSIVATEQLEIAKLIWEKAQDPTRSNAQIDVSIPTPTPSGITRNLSWKRAQAKSWASILNEMANRENGFEWLVNCYTQSNGERVREVNFGYPTLSRENSLYRFYYPGNISSYEITVDYLSGATRFQARGDAPDPISGVSQEPLMSDVVELDWPKEQGLIAQDYTIDRNGVSQKATLDMWAQRYADASTGPLYLSKIKCHLDSLNDGAIIGQKIYASIIDAAFRPDAEGHPTNEQIARVIGFEISPGDRSSMNEVLLLLEHSTEGVL